MIRYHNAFYRVAKKLKFEREDGNTYILEHCGFTCFVARGYRFRWDRVEEKPWLARVDRDGKTVFNLGKYANASEAMDDIREFLANSKTCQEWLAENG